jgi:hypothetical protein
MTGVICQIFVYLLAVYGAIALVICIASSVAKIARDEKPGMKMVLVVKNQGDCIEGTVKNLLSSNFLGKTIPAKTLTVVDMGSTDDTGRILELLKNDYEFLDVKNQEDRDSIFEGLE